MEKSDKADYKVRFFTPTEEVDLCGHATIATYSFLFQKGLIQPGNYTQEIKAGILGIEVKTDGLIVMEQSRPIFSEVIEKAQIADIFTTPIDMLDLKPQIVSTGARDIFLPIATRKQLISLRPNFSKIAALNKATITIGIHTFTMDTIDPSSIAHSRNFAPLYGIDEESATGSSTGALACYLYKQRKLDGKSLKEMRFEQGYSMNQPSELFVTLDTDGDDINHVFVGGRAIVFGEKEVEI